LGHLLLFFCTFFLFFSLVYPLWQSKKNG
jgi:hypothetical protein